MRPRAATERVDRRPGAPSLQDLRRFQPPDRTRFRARGATVNPAERHQMLSALILLIIALFVAGGVSPAVRWRRELRIGAVLAFCIAIGWVLIEIGLWWAAGAR
jgi:hypothetical protein